MWDLYNELNSKETKRQKPVLLSLSFAGEMAKCFDFRIGNLLKFAEWKLRRDERKRRYLTRKEFIGFTMSFVEPMNPMLLRGILQHKDMYSGVILVLGNDDYEEIAVCALLYAARECVCSGYHWCSRGLEVCCLGVLL